MSFQSESIQEAYNNKLKNKLFGLLCEFEKEMARDAKEKTGDWEKFLDSILIELEGFSEEEKTINFLVLFHKLSAARYLSYKYFRSTIFDCMNLVEKV